jgi:predicted RNA polymerase sigma factor
VLGRREEDLAGGEDAVQGALVAAAQHWPKEGVAGTRGRGWAPRPAAPWSTSGPSVGARRRREEAVAALEGPGQAAPFGRDDSLALLLLCWHPGAGGASQLGLTLGAVGGVAPLVDVPTEPPGVGVAAVADPMSHSNIGPYGWDLSRATSGYSSAGP